MALGLFEDLLTSRLPPSLLDPTNYYYYYYYYYRHYYSYDCYYELYYDYHWYYWHVPGTVSITTALVFTQGCCDKGLQLSKSADKSCKL